MLQIYLPIVTYPDPNSDAVAANAAEVAALLGGHLHAMALLADIPDISSALSRFLLDLPEMVRDAEMRSRQNGDHLIGLVEKEARLRGLPLTTDSAPAGLAEFGEIAVVEARYHDLVLFGWEAKSETSPMVAEALIFGAGRPVLLMPSQSQLRTLKRIAIAWDGSRVAARAVADAAPFLNIASEATVLTALDEKPLPNGGGGERLAEALRKRGLTATAKTIETVGSPIADALQQQAVAAGADLLVMGGYGHSRLRDFVLGGATAGVLEDLRLPVLLSH
jgi:nucleotide-binding universal stress UspA family protein